MRSHLGDRKFFGSVCFVGPHASADATIEDLTIYVNPSTGSDFSILYRMNRQSDFSAHGPFASFKGAVAALPSSILHAVSLKHSSGSFNVPEDYFGDLSRLTFGPNASLLYDSVDPMMQCAGSSNMPALPSGADIVTLASDPGYVTNTYRGKWLYVLSGTGVGQLKAVRSHAATAWTVAGRFSPAPSSDTILQIVEPAVTLTVLKSDYAIVNLFGSGPDQGSITYEGTDRLSSLSSRHVPVQFGRLAITSDDTYLQIGLRDAGVSFDGTILRKVNIFAENSLVYPRLLISDNTGTRGRSAVDLVDGSIFSPRSNEGSVLLRNYNEGIDINGGDMMRTCYADVHHMAIDSCRDAVRVTRNGVLYIVNYVRSADNTRWGINFPSSYSSGEVHVYLAETSAGTLTGSSGDINLRGTPISYSDIAADPEHEINYGNLLSVVGE